MTAVYKAAAAEETKDPRRQQIAKKKAELAALKGKEEPTEAEQELMAALADEIERLEEAAESGVTLEGATASSGAQAVGLPGSPRHRPSQGSSVGTPVGAKSATLRVTTVMPCTSAVAAMSPSRRGRGSGT